MNALTWPLWWFRAYRGCGWSVLRSLRAAWVLRRADPRGLPEMVAGLLAEDAGR